MPSRAMEPATQPPSGDRTERLGAAAELLVASALVVGANIYDVVPITETPWIVALGWVSLRLRGLTWRAVGLRPPRSWPRTVAVAIAAGVVLQVLSEFVTEPAVAHFTGREPDLSDFQYLVGNLPGTLGMLALVWTLAAFGEEMAYRGYMLDRGAAIGGSSTLAYVIALISVSLFFGVGHVYQGVAGVIGSAVSGLYFGALYLASGRNLWLPILAHGCSDTLGLGIIYLGLAPGL